jgi:hypothetical protein
MKPPLRRVQVALRHLFVYLEQTHTGGPPGAPCSSFSVPPLAVYLIQFRARTARVTDCDAHRGHWHWQRPVDTEPFFGSMGYGRRDNRRASGGGAAGKRPESAMVQSRWVDSDEHAAAFHPRCDGGDGEAPFTQAHWQVVVTAPLSDGRNGRLNPAPPTRHPTRSLLTWRVPRQHELARPQSRRHC